jgi:hypothetical protein
MKISLPPMLKITIKSSTETKTVYAEEDGTYKDYRLKADDVYEISAVFEGLLSEPQTVSTKGLKSSGVLNAQLNYYWRTC